MGTLMQNNPSELSATCLVQKKSLIQKDGIRSVFEVHDNNLTRKLSDGVKRNVIFTITGASGVGKDSILNSILETDPHYIKPVSFTTRKPRPGEAEGADYYFISLEEFKRLKENGEIFENTVVSGNYYGYTNAELERVFLTGKIPVCIVDEVGVHEIVKNIKGDLNVFKTFILPPTAIELGKRLKGRELENSIKIHTGKNEKLSRDELISIKKESRISTKKRFAESKHWIRKAKSEEIYDGFLVNDDIEGAISILRETFERILDGRL